MINIPTVLILGAGSSTHCEYPLGMQLISNLCTRGRLSKIDVFPDDWQKIDAEMFLTRLSRSAYYSIDAFLETDREHSSLGKYLIAQELKKHEDIDNLFPPHNSGWYQYLFNSLLVDGKPNFSSNKLNIITFNYDRSLEAYLYTALQNRFQISAGEAEDILKGLPIIHVHGILGEFPLVPYRSQCDITELISISQEIRIIYEIPEHDGDFCNDMFRKAHDMLLAAQRIFFLGFGFHQDNIRRFRFFTEDSIKDKMLRATFYGWGDIQRENFYNNLSIFGFNKMTIPRIPNYDCNNFFNNYINLE